MDNLSYPIGDFQEEPNPSGTQKLAWLDIVEATPLRLRQAVAGLNTAQLDTPYREGGWTVRQVIHHVADSHMQSYSRFRFALTETAPPIRPYQEKLWAELTDANSAPVEISLSLLDALHARWMILLKGFTAGDWSRTYVHPDMGPVSLLKALQLYAWHGSHHEAHITRLRERMGW